MVSKQHVFFLNSLTPYLATGRAKQASWLAPIHKQSDLLKLYLELSASLELLYLLQCLLDDNRNPNILSLQLGRRTVICFEREPAVNIQLSRPSILLTCLGTTSAYVRQTLGPLPYPSFLGWISDGWWKDPKYSSEWLIGSQKTQRLLKLHIGKVLVLLTAQSCLSYINLFSRLLPQVMFSDDNEQPPAASPTHYIHSVSTH